MTALRRHGVEAALCLSVIAAAGACGHRAAEEVETTTTVTVTTAPAIRGTIRAVVHATGVVSPAPGAALVVVAPEPARIAEIPRASGERVRRGDMLVRFEIPASAAEVQKQQAEVARAEAGLENANAAQTRGRELFDHGVAARKEVEQANRALADAEAALAQAKAALNAAEMVERRATVRATFDGVIAKRYHNPGDLVEAAASDPVLHVIDPDRLEIVAGIPLSDAARVQVGARGHIVNAPTGAADIELKVESPPTAVEPGTATVPVRLGFARAISIPVGTPVQVDIAAEEHRDVVVVPAAAVVREGGEAAVFVVSEGKAQRRGIEAGLTDGPNVEIISGAAAGDRVIVDGQAGLPDGAPVTEAAPSGKGPPPAEKDGAP
jgi:membrane fusion protein, multidrug efflux system